MLIIQNAEIVLPDEVKTGNALYVNGDRISKIGPLTETPAAADEVIDAQGGYVFPGFIDIHSDYIEKTIAPRPSSVMDFAFALEECERELALHGVTTIYHSISSYKKDFFGTNPVRTQENFLKLNRIINDYRKGTPLIRHRFHLRYEIDNVAFFGMVRNFLAERGIDELSFMDHTPGQGQYRDLEVYAKALDGYSGEDYKKMGMAGVIKFHKEKKRLSFEQMKELTDLAHSRKIPVASHDDDCDAKLEVNRKLGVDISEFPITLDVARSAKRSGFYTVVGAPNILLGGSHSGNMNAGEAIAQGCADILCSDYYPQALLQSVFRMSGEGGVPLQDMVAKLTLNPARAMKIDADYGSLECGKKADMLIVRNHRGRPVITDVFVDGKKSLSVRYGG